MVFKSLCILVRWTKVATALEGLLCPDCRMFPCVFQELSLCTLMKFVSAEGQTPLRKMGDKHLYFPALLFEVCFYLDIPSRSLT